MPYVTAFLAALVVLLIALLFLERRRYDKHSQEREAAFRLERIGLINKIARPEQPMHDGRPIPKRRPARSPETLREFARVGTVRPPTPSQPGDDAA